MATNTAFNQIFSDQITTRIFEENTFLEKIPNYSEYLNGKFVNIPSTYLFPANITINGTVTNLNNFVETQEQFVQFELDNFRIDPVKVENFSDLITSYDRMAFTAKEQSSQLGDAFAKNVLYKIAKDVDATRIVKTTGASAPNGFNGESYKSLQFTDVVNLKKAFDKDAVPQSNRFLILDEQFYADMLNSDQLNKQMQYNIQDEGLAKSGALCTLLGITIIMKPTIAAAYAGTSGDGILPFSYSKDRNFPAGSRRVALAFQSDSLAMAMSAPKVYVTPDFANAYGSFFSAEINGGVINKRKSLDNRGVYLLMQQV